MFRLHKVRWIKAQRLAGSCAGLAGLVVALVAFPVLSLAQTTEETPCKDSVSAPFWIRPPGIFLGASINFAERVVKAFPVGSAERDLMDWLDNRGFGEVSVGDWDTGFVDTDEERTRLTERRESGEVINMRRLKTWAPIGTSYFFVAWNADPCGLLTEVYADTELFHFDLP